MQGLKEFENFGAADAYWFELVKVFRIKFQEGMGRIFCMFRFPKLMKITDACEHEKIKPKFLHKAVGLHKKEWMIGH